MTGLENYRGVTPGVSALFVGSGSQVDFPCRFQAQVIGITALALWGFLCGLILCAPLGWIFHGSLHRQDAPSPATIVTPVAQTPAMWWCVSRPPLPHRRFCAARDGGAVDAPAGRTTVRV